MALLPYDLLIGIQVPPVDVGGNDVASDAAAIGFAKLAHLGLDAEIETSGEPVAPVDQQIAFTTMRSSWRVPICCAWWDAVPITRHAP